MSDLRTFLGRSKSIRKIYRSYRVNYCKLYRYINHNNDTSPEPTSQSLDLSETDYTLDTGSAFPDKARLAPHPEASNPVLTKDDINDAVAAFVADPFLVYEDGIYHMFFEIKNVVGEVFIGHAYSEDGIEYEYNKTVIGPVPAQHTYPHVFRYDGSWVMVPSPGSNVTGEFRIYRAVGFPTSWELLGVPIPTGVRVDPTPIRHDGIWYVIYQETDSFDIVLKYSDSLLGEQWEEHPNSPIFSNDPTEINKSQVGRAEMAPSGRPLYRTSGIDIFYRSHLDCDIHQYRIERLSPEKFKQRLITSSVFQKVSRDDWNRRFMHTVNPLYPWDEDRNIVAVDGLRADSYTYSIGIYSFER